jgi:hypothetical protein
MWQDSDITGGKVRLKFSTTPGEAIGADGLAPGEIAVNVADGKVYYKNSSGSVGCVPSGVTSDITVTTPSGDYNLSFVNGVCTSIAPLS